MALLCLQQPAQEPVEVHEMKDYLRVTEEEESPLIQRLIQSARQFVEEYTGRSLLSQLWQLQISRGEPKSSPLLSLFHGGEKPFKEIGLMRGPVISLESVSQGLPGGDIKILSPSQYQLTPADGWSRLHLPPSLWHEKGEWTIVYKTGYGTEPEEVPSILRQAIFMQVAALYENRGDQTTAFKPLESICWLLQPYRVRYFCDPSIRI